MGEGPEGGGFGLTSTAFSSIYLPYQIMVAAGQQTTPFPFPLPSLPPGRKRKGKPYELLIILQHLMGFSHKGIVSSGRPGIETSDKRDPQTDSERGGERGVAWHSIDVLTGYLGFSVSAVKLEYARCLLSAVKCQSHCYLPHSS